MDAILLSNVKKNFLLGSKASGTHIPVIDSISLRVKKGEFVGIIGPNGCGKTTLLKIIAGLEKTDSGRISVFGKTPGEVAMGFVPQHTATSLLPWFNATENVAFAHKEPQSREAKLAAMQKLSDFGISHYADAYPYQLSGGLKQLVSIARATVSSDILLFDEPLNGLDYHNQMLVEKIFLKLRDENTTAFMISHNIESAVLACDKIVVLSDKPAGIKAAIEVNLPGKRDWGMRFTNSFNLISKEVFNILQGA